MLIEKQINGDTCLCYEMEEAETLQSFHLGMLTTNRQLPAVPIHCQYVEGNESLIMPLHELIPVHALVENQKGLPLEQLMLQLGKSIQTLMAYQLKPENMVFDERYMFMDSSYKTVHLVYLPTNAEYAEPKAALSDLLLKWIDQYMDKNGALAHPLFVQLLLKLRQDSCSFRTLVELLVKVEWQEPIKDNRDAAISPQTMFEQDEMPTINNQLKLPKEKKAVEKKESEFQFKVNQKQLIILGPVGLALAMSGGVFIFAPMAASSKLGVCMVIVATSLYMSQKLNEKFGRLASLKVAQVAPKEEKPILKQKEASPQPIISDVKWLSASEETILLSEHVPKAVLMVRENEGPRYYNMQKDLVAIGRNPSVCDLVLDETGIGRLHAEVHHNQGQYYIRDNQSLNGTYVNGKRITSNQYFQLKTGDLIKIAHKEMVFS